MGNNNGMGKPQERNMSQIHTNQESFVDSRGLVHYVGFTTLELYEMGFITKSQFQYTTLNDNMKSIRKKPYL